MKLFDVTSKKVEEVEQLSFKLEKDIQNLIEPNVETFFGLKFIKSEFTVDKYRIDTLCFNEETNSFVIIEYKKGNSYSVIDQGYTYLQLLLNHKSDFLLVLSQYFNKVMRFEEVDWSQSRIIFVSPSFNSYQKDSVNFKDLPFELWEIKKYSNNFVIMNQHHSNSKESIESLSPSNESIVHKVNQEVRVYSNEDHISNLSPTMVEKWESILERLDELSGVQLNPKRHYIGFVLNNGKSVCLTKFRKNHIYFSLLRGSLNPDGTYSKGYFTLDDPKGVSVEKSRDLNSDSRQFSYGISVDSKFDIDYLFFLLKQKYNQLM